MDINTVEQKILDKATEVLVLARSKGWLLEKNVTIIPYHADNRPAEIKSIKFARAAGVFFPKTFNIYYNASMAAHGPSALDDMLNDTVAHEIAHAVVRAHYPYVKQQHGPEFRRVCRILGGTGATCYTNSENKEFAAKYKKPRKPRAKSRYVYLSPYGVEVLLTKQRHDNMQKYKSSVIHPMKVWYTSDKLRSSVGPNDFTGEVRVI